MHEMPIFERERAAVMPAIPPPIMRHDFAILRRIEGRFDGEEVEKLKHFDEL